MNSALNLSCYTGRSKKSGICEFYEQENELCHTNARVITGSNKKLKEIIIQSSYS